MPRDSHSIARGAWLSAAWVLLTAAPGWSATPLGTGFTYQGQLKLAGSPLDGSADIQFALWDDVGSDQPPTGGNQIGTAQTLSNIAVVNGLFTVELNAGGQFGPNAFNGEARWLEIAVRSPAGGGPFTTLSPRQPLKAGPYAHYAQGGPGGAGGFWAANGPDIFSTNAGNVGIGATSPQRRLDIAGSGARISHTIEGSDGPRLELKGPATGLSFTVGALDFVDANDVAAGSIHYIRSLIGDRLWLSAGGQERLAIDQDGRVGIGTAGPQAMLQVEGPNDIPLILAENNWYAIRGTHEGTSGTFPGVWGDSNSESASATGLRGIINSTTPGAGSTGVLGLNNGTSGNGYGVVGRHLGNGAGVFGEALGTSGSVGVRGTGYFGVSGTATDASGYGGIFGGSGAFGGGRALLVAGESHLAGPVGVGTTTIPAGVSLNVNGTARTKVLEIAGADVAEKFPASEAVKPGMVVAIDTVHAGKLCLARGAYNRCVAGIVSGATPKGEGRPRHAAFVSPGAVLGHLPGDEDAPPIALTGRVYCWCDATSGAIQPGDLLTTSNRPGHAMRVDDHARAQGAILGKAMTDLARDQRGLVLVLVALQ